MEKLKKRMMILFVVGIFLVPVVSIAGSLEPSAAPAPTMKTLDQIPPTWSQKLPAAQRFELVFDGFAVLDKETGLVWEKSPVTSVSSTWINAIGRCEYLGGADRGGWHLPTIEQLGSLIDTSVTSAPKLPSGHPFNVDLMNYYTWSATSYATITSAAWYVNFYYGQPSYLDKGQQLGRAWCVRGGQSYDGQ